MRAKQIALALLFSAMAIVGNAQPAVQPQDPQKDPDAVPITGLEYLLIGGGVYGVSRLLKNKKVKDPE